MRRLLAALLFLLVAAGAAADQLTETMDRTFDVKPGANVVLTNVNGRVTVASWDQPRVRVIARKEVKADEDVIKAAMKELRVEIQPREGGLVITTHQPRHNDGWAALFDWIAGDHVQAQVRYEITVPRSMNVEVENTNGSIHATGLAGKLELGTTNGRIEVIRCAGIPRCFDDERFDRRRTAQRREGAAAELRDHEWPYRGRASADAGGRHRRRHDERRNQDGPAGPDAQFQPQLVARHDQRRRHAAPHAYDERRDLDSVGTAGGIAGQWPLQAGRGERAAQTGCKPMAFT